MFILFGNSLITRAESRVIHAELLGIEEGEAEKVFYALHWTNLHEEDFQKSDSPIKDLIITNDCIIIGLINNRIAVLNLDGQYQCGYSFKTTGQYEIFYNADYDVFTIYIWRGGVFFTFDKKGSLIAVEKSDVMNKNGMKYCYKGLDDDNANRYFLNSSNKNVIFGRGADQILKRTQNGNDEIIYRIKLSLISSDNVGKVIIVFSLFCMIGVITFSLFRTKGNIKMCLFKLEKWLNRISENNLNQWKSLFKK